LRTNRIPKGLVPLEKLFDKSDAFKGTNKSKLDEHVIELNVGSKESPRIIKIGQGCTQVERRRLEALVREYKDVFAWSYDDLKAYDPKVIEHAIPLRKEAKPFRQATTPYEPQDSSDYIERVAEVT
jgi:hypothetical protein